MTVAAAVAAQDSYRQCTDLGELQALLDSTLLEESALDAELEALLAKRNVRAQPLHESCGNRPGHSSVFSELILLRRRS